MFHALALLGAAPGYAGGICATSQDAQLSALLYRSAIDIMNNELSSYLQSPLLFSEDRFVQAMKDTARQQTNLEEATTVLQYGSSIFFQYVCPICMHYSSLVCQLVTRSVHHNNK
jgi:hypothetical protein